MSTPIAPAGPPSKARSRTRTVLRAVAVIVLAFVAAGLIGQLVSGDDDTDKAGKAAAPSSASLADQQRAQEARDAYFADTPDPVPTTAAPVTTTQAPPPPPAPPTTQAPPPPAPDPTPAVSVEALNALRSAESYIAMTGFSRAGLIQQLSSEYGEGYSVEASTWAADHVGADWMQEAVESGQAYLDMTGFSRSGLIEQLSSEYGEQFTLEQATYAADQLGL